MHRLKKNESVHIVYRKRSLHHLEVCSQQQTFEDYLLMEAGSDLSILNFFMVAFISGLHGYDADGSTSTPHSSHSLCYILFLLSFSFSLLFSFSFFFLFLFLSLSLFLSHFLALATFSPTSQAFTMFSLSMTRKSSAVVREHEHSLV
ncbi:ZMIZ [Balamuthia mandrillaris]